MRTIISLGYTYKKINYKYYLDNLIIVKDTNNNIDISRKQGSYFVSVTKDCYCYEYFIPELYLKEATLNELLYFDKPIILTKDSKCEYINQISIYEFSFITESCGKMINLTFNSDDILAYFKDSNTIYVYNKGLEYNNHINIYSNYTEKHTIVNDFGLFSNYYDNNGKSKGMFSPLSDKEKVMYFKSYKSFDDKFNIAPYYIRNYYEYSRYPNSSYKSIKPIEIEGKEYNIVYDNLILKNSFKNNKIYLRKYESYKDNIYIEIDIKGTL